MRKLGPPPDDIAIMADIPDIWQWCLPFRRQQAGRSFPVNARATGAIKLQAMTASTRLVAKRRIRFVKASILRGAVTNTGKQVRGLWLGQGGALRSSPRHP